MPKKQFCKWGGDLCGYELMLRKVLIIDWLSTFKKYLYVDLPSPDI